MPHNSLVQTRVREKTKKFIDKYFYLISLICAYLWFLFKIEMGENEKTTTTTKLNLFPKTEKLCHLERFFFQ